MKKIIILLIGMLFLGLCITTVTADPTVDEITTEPTKPTPLSTVKVIATITGENIISVKLTVAECDDESCFLSHPSIEMNMNENGKYEAELTLEDDKNRANHIQYQFTINDNGTEYPLTNENWKTYLNLQNTGDGGSNGNDTTGFEILTLFIAIIIGIFIYKKKR
jgi:hypothetical protein